MNQLSPHFSRSEFACNCGCGFDTVDTATLDILEQVRTHFAVPVTITSGCRCPNYNASVGGATKSQHILARAADIQVQGIEPEAVASYVEDNFHTASIGRYATFTHIDTRTNGPARWED